MSGEQPKKPPSSYMLYCNDIRESVFKSCPAGEKKIPWAARKMSEMWKAAPEEEKKKYEKQASERKEAFEEEMKKFKAEGGEVQARKRKGKKGEDDADTTPKKRGKKDKDPNKPKKPAGGAYGCYMTANRADIQKELGPGKSVAEVSKVAGARWKALSAADKAPFEEKYQKLKADYEAAMKTYKSTAAASGGGDKDESDGEES